MATHTDRKGRITKTMILIGGMGLLLGGAMGVTAQTDQDRLLPEREVRHKIETGPSLNAYADISVTYQNNSTGFTAASTKDLSNIVVTYCDNTAETLEFGDGNETYTHSGDSTIRTLTAKSGVSEVTARSGACATEEEVLTRS